MLNFPRSVKVVDSWSAYFDEELTTRQNAICFPGALTMDFSGVARQILGVARGQNRKAVAVGSGFSHKFEAVDYNFTLRERALKVFTPLQRRAFDELGSVLEMMYQNGFRHEGVRVQNHHYRNRKDDDKPHPDGGTERILIFCNGTTARGFSTEDVTLDEYANVLGEPDLSKSFAFPLKSVVRFAGAALYRHRQESIPPFIHFAQYAERHNPRMLSVCSKKL